MFASLFDMRHAARGVTQRTLRDRYARHVLHLLHDAICYTCL